MTINVGLLKKKKIVYLITITTLGLFRYLM